MSKKITKPELIKMISEEFNKVNRLKNLENKKNAMKMISAIAKQFIVIFLSMLLI